MNLENEIDRRRAILAVQEGLTAEESHISESRKQTYDVLAREGRNLEGERISGILRLITNLQAEGSSVLEQKVALLEIKEKASAAASVGEATAQEASLISENTLRETIAANSAQVERSLSYLR